MISLILRSILLTWKFRISCSRNGHQVGMFHTRDFRKMKGTYKVLALQEKIEKNGWPPSVQKSYHSSAKYQKVFKLFMFSVIFNILGFSFRTAQFVENLTTTFCAEMIRNLLLQTYLMIRLMLFILSRR